MRWLHERRNLRASIAVLLVSCISLSVLSAPASADLRTLRRNNDIFGGLVVAGLICFAFPGTPCRPKPKPPSVDWSGVIADCAGATRGDIDRVYFTASNNIGAGAVYDYTPGLPVVLDAVLTPDVMTAEHAKHSVISGNGTFSCTRVVNENWDVRAALPINLPTQNIPAADAQLNAQLTSDSKTASSITVSFDGAVFEQLDKTPYVTFAAEAGTTNPAFVKKLYSDANAIVLVNDISIRNLKVQITFSATESAALSAKYNGRFLNSGTDGAKLTVNVDASGTVTLTAQDPFVISAQFRRASEFAPVASLPKLAPAAAMQLSVPTMKPAPMPAATTLPMVPVDQSGYIELPKKLQIDITKRVKKP